MTSGVSRFESIEKLTVQLDFLGQVFDVGTLAWDHEERRAYFEYAREFLAEPLPLSPFKLATSEGAKPAPYQPFGGLHGMFNDSIPDGWGRLLLERRLQKLNYDFRLLTPLDRLAHVGTGGMGALRYRPAKTFGKSGESGIDLDWLAKQATAVQEQVDEGDIDRLQEIQGGSAGVRPKIIVGLNSTTGKLMADAGSVLPEGFDAWMVKFKSNMDPAEVGTEEYTYSLMARAAGVEMPDTRLISTGHAKYFAVRRFDRTPEGSVHVQSASALLEADHRTPAIDYDTLLKLTRLLTRDERNVRQMFVRMVFNILALNRDDHSRNHAFLMTADGTWHPTPAYDLTLSEGPGGEHNLLIDGEGKHPAEKNVMAVAERASIPKADARQILEQVRSAIDKWPEHAGQADLSTRRTTEIDRLLNRRS